MSNKNNLDENQKVLEVNKAPKDKLNLNIPSEINIMGQTIKIEFSEKLITEGDNVGQACFRENKIKIQKNLAGFPRTKEQIEETFLHEVLHFIFHQLGDNELRDNEKLSIQVSGLLYQVLKTYFERNDNE